MAEKIPLNLYKRVTKKLKITQEPIYTVPVNQATTLISTIGSNNTNGTSVINLSLSSTDIPNGFTILQDISLQPLEYTNILPSKLVLKEGDTIIASANVDDEVYLTFSILESINTQ
jgi:hypothetical protein